MKAKPKVKRCTGRELAKALAKVNLTDEESHQWRHELEAARKALKPQRDKWQ